MTDAFSGLSNTDLQTLIASLRSQRVVAPYSELQVSRIVPSGWSGVVVAGLNELDLLGLTPEQVAAVLELLVRDRQERKLPEPPIDLVTTGPETQGITNRDTSVVVRELFAHAQECVLVVGYAVYQGQRVFETLAKRMEESPELDVQFFLDISRPDGDTTASDIVVSRFTQRFRQSQWPVGCRLPEVYYDPRSISDEEPVRSSLHAKCVVVDRKHVFVSSANFTEAGQERNIEVGLSIKSPWLAERLIRHFRLLHEHGLVVRAF